LTSLELKVPPVVVLLLSAAAMWIVKAGIPGYALQLPAQGVIAALVFTVGLAIGVRGVLVFRRHETTVNPTTPDAATSVVTTDVFRFTRNPMYVALTLVLVAWGAVLASLPALFVVPAFIAYMTRFQILPEERALAARFGAAYDEYRRTVRRWI
jgi:protein-S-isoprenylcysteine O-methyltransferase Ste14